MAFIVPFEGGNPTEVPASPGELTIGRAEDNSIQIEDVKSSRNHCAVFQESGAFKLRDNESRNGTLLNDQPVSVSPLRDGDVITIGKTRLVFRVSLDAAYEDAGGPETEEKWILVLVKEDGEEQVFDLGERITVGRKPSNTIQIRDTKASGVNTEIVQDGPGYTVRDLNSTNGTRVDGKLISEPMGLYHGSVITVGKTDFVIKNTAIPDLGDAGFESQALGGEDFTAFARKRRSRMPVGLLLLLILAGGGLFAFQKLATEVVVPKKTELSPEGNLLRENYSFEGGGDTNGFPVGFRGFFGENDTIQVIKGAAPTGSFYSEIQKGENSPPAAEAELIYAGTVDTSSGSVYEFRAQLKPEGLRGVGGLKMTWVKKKDPLYRRVSTSSLVSGDGDWQEVTLRAVPPEGVTGLEVSIFFTGSEGSLLCDDMQLYKRSRERLAETLEGRKLWIGFDNHGVFTVGQTGIIKDLIWNGQIILVGREGKSKSFQMFSTLDEGSPKTGKDRVEYRGRIYEFLSGTWVPFTLVAEVKEGEVHIAYTVTPPAGVVDLAGVAFSPDRAKIAHGVGIGTSDSYDVMMKTFEKDLVKRMIWGRGGGMLSLNYDPPVTCLQKREAKEIKFLQIVPPDEKGAFRMALHFQTEFGRAVQEVLRLKGEAEEARKEDRPGRAAERLREILTLYPYHKDAPWAGKEIEGIEKTFREKVDGIRARLGKAKFFSDLTEMRALRDEAAILLETYRGCSGTEEMESLHKEIGLAFTDLKISMGKIQVEGLMLRAADYIEMKDLELATAFLRYIISEFPGTEWVKSAEEMLMDIEDIRAGRPPGSSREKESGGDGSEEEKSGDEKKDDSGDEKKDESGDEKKEGEGSGD
jgi:pSer/pThr/pTyr-binding forkhead associated (FHA) protein